MNLREFQAALGHAMCDQQQLAITIARFHAADSMQITRLVSSAGFAFTCAVQRSWCESRLKLLARHTLGSLPPEQCNMLVTTWVSQGGGRKAFGTEEAIEFLEFVAGHLQDDPAHLFCCRVEQAINRASIGRLSFARPAWPSDVATLIGRGDCSSMVTSSDAALFFAPGLPGLVRDAAPIERRLWKRLDHARPVHTFPNATHAALVTMLSDGILGTFPPFCSANGAGNISCEVDMVTANNLAVPSGA